MATALKAVGVSPASNPDKVTLQLTFSGNYVSPEPLNLAPYDAGNNPGGVTNPLLLELPSMPLGLSQAPSVLAEDIGGYYVQLDPLVPSGETNGVQNSLKLDGGVSLKIYSSEGNELAAGAYPAALLDGSVLLEMVLPKNE